MKFALTIVTMVIVAWSTSAVAATGQERKEIKVDPKIYDTYTGEYELEFSPNDSITIAISRDGDKLMGQASGKPKIQLFPETEKRFFAKAADLQIEFVAEKDGKVSHLILTDSGKTHQAKKVK